MLSAIKSKKLQTMNLSISNIKFKFKTFNDSSDEFVCDTRIKNINVEFSINRNYFENKNIEWKFVENFLIHFVNNIDFINEKSRKISQYLYNEYGNKTNPEDKFTLDKCKFTNQLLIQFEEPPYLYPYPISSLIYNVENVIDSEFTYLSNYCKFADYKTAFFVGVKASSIQE